MSAGRDPERDTELRADEAGADGAYRAATEAVVRIERPDLRVLRVHGRAPARMLLGLVSGSIPGDPVGESGGTLRGTAPYSTLLTPKGRIVTDLRIVRVEPGEEGALLLILPEAGIEEALRHMARYLPPRFARVEDPTPPMGILTLAGPAWASALGPPGIDLGPPLPEVLAEGAEIIPGPGPFEGLRILGSDDLRVPSVDLLAPASLLTRVQERLAAAEVPRADGYTREVLRVERGRPRFGLDFDTDTLPHEAGLEERAIDHRKGCYTGQEVVVRIRDRGQVQRRLRGLRLGGAPPPAAGTALYPEGGDRAVGEVRSAVRSPAFGETIALGYLRREVDPPATVRLGDPSGPPVQVQSLETGWEAAARTS